MEKTKKKGEKREIADLLGGPAPAAVSRTASVTCAPASASDRAVSTPMPEERR